jgi:N-formylglutamate deformylase
MNADMPVFRLQRGNSPLLVSIPHVGTHLPSWLLPRLTPAALSLRDTDWHLDQLYGFLSDLDVTVLMATHSRYVIDLNRPSDNVSLYPGQNTTGLCPLDNFDEQALYNPGEEPDSREIHDRVATYWQPYHAALASELSRLKAMHGRIILWDAHSIHSRVPRFFEGELPHLNLGTADQLSCDAALAERLLDIMQSKGNFTSVMNGRFKGGYITRHYGQPASGVHALQMEMAIRTYMAETDFPEFDAARAEPAQALLRAMMAFLLQWCSENQHE